MGSVPGTLLTSLCSPCSPPHFPLLCLQSEPASVQALAACSSLQQKQSECRFLYCAHLSVGRQHRRKLKVPNWRTNMITNSSKQELVRMQNRSTTQSTIGNTKKTKSSYTEAHGRLACQNQSTVWSPRNSTKNAALAGRSSSPSKSPIEFAATAQDCVAFSTPEHQEAQNVVEVAQV